MLNFSEEFFKAEEIEGFYVESTMKRYWACLMDIMDVIDKVCEKYNLKYYVYGGTLLGAARHQGFIPWDDDIDLAMKRPDYMKLLEVLPKELPPGYWLSTPFTNERHKQFFVGVSNGKEVDCSKEHLSRFYGCPFVATLDIFPLDYLPRNQDEADIVKAIFTVIWHTMDLVNDQAEPDVIEESLQNVEEYCGVVIDRSKPIKSTLWQLTNRLLASFTEADGDELVEWCFYVNQGDKFKFDKKWYDEVVDLPFENVKVSAPKEYDAVLSQIYGDWRTPVRGSQFHNYPIYKKQLEFLKRKVEEMKKEAGET